MMEKGTARLITFGLGGHSVELEYSGNSISPTSHLSGYDDPESFWRRHNGEDPSDRYPDGCPVIDKRAILQEHPGLAFTSPMAKIGIDEPEIFNGQDSLIAQAVLKDPGNTFGTYLRIDRTQKKFSKEPSSLDYVPIPYYVEWWRKRGARIGMVQNGQFIWEHEQGETCQTQE